MRVYSLSLCFCLQPIAAECWRQTFENSSKKTIFNEHPVPFLQKNSVMECMDQSYIFIPKESNRTFGDKTHARLNYKLTWIGDHTIEQPTIGNDHGLK